MRLGISFGPLKFWIQIGGRRRRRAVSKCEPTKEPRRTTSRINGAPTPALKPPAPEVVSPLLVQARADAMSALVTLGYSKRIAQARVNAVTDATTTNAVGHAVATSRWKPNPRRGRVNK
jgi:hypothetical protein